jgi:hypothetical protein
MFDMPMKCEQPVGAVRRLSFLNANYLMINYARLTLYRTLAADGCKQ